MSEPHKKWKASELLHQLYINYQQYEMSTAVIPEASIGFHNSYNLGHAELASIGSETTVRRIDALVLFRDKRWAVEIKVSKSDLNYEIAHPEKSALWLLHTHSYYFLVTPQLVEHAMAVVPKHFGIMAVETGYGPVQILRRAKKNLDPLPLPYATILRMGVAYGKAYRDLRN